MIQLCCIYIALLRLVQGKLELSSFVHSIILGWPHVTDTSANCTKRPGQRWSFVVQEVVKIFAKWTFPCVSRFLLQPLKLDNLISTYLKHIFLKHGLNSPSFANTAYSPHCLARYWKRMFFANHGIELREKTQRCGPSSLCCASVYR